MTLLDVLIDQRDHNVDGSVYKAVQCDLAYNSNKIEGSRLTYDQTVSLWDHDVVHGVVYRDDVVVMGNHFRVFDELLDTVDCPLTHDFVKRMHAVLFAGTRKSGDPRYSVGEYKRFANVISTAIGSVLVAKPSEVYSCMEQLFSDWEEVGSHSVEDIIDFHVRFESIHPFSDGNGRIGRLLMFKECLRNDVIPFIITDDLRPYYIRGLQMYDKERGYLVDTCLTAQDRFEAVYLPLSESYAEALSESDDVKEALNALPRNPLFPDKVQIRDCDACFGE